MTSGWQRIGPTFHAFGWLYRAPLMQALLDAFDDGEPSLNPLDVWVWEVMAANDMLAHALAPTSVLVDARGGVKAAERGVGSVKAAHCDPCKAVQVSCRCYEYQTYGYAVRGRVMTHV
eukprot:285418-Prymnesium_polylepis.2